MNVFIRPIGLHSRAMLRVNMALRRYAPEGINIVERVKDADVQVLHVIGYDGLDKIKCKEYVAIQYCVGSTDAHISTWQGFWDRCRFVWSYYDLQDKTGSVPFYFAPLGVDGDTFKLTNTAERNAVMTSGYVSGPSAEPIEEMSFASEKANYNLLHLGPSVIEGMSQYPLNRQTYLDIDDDQLAELYNKCSWVSGMRHIEGFELPVIEALACGARPIVFDRPDMRRWYDGHAVFVPESDGETLQDILVNVLLSPIAPVTMDERKVILEKFNWETIAKGFWSYLNV